MGIRADELVGQPMPGFLFERERPWSRRCFDVADGTPLASGCAFSTSEINMIIRKLDISQSVLQHSVSHRRLPHASAVQPVAPAISLLASMCDLPTGLYGDAHG